jgi:hypothetical protein
LKTTETYTDSPSETPGLGKLAIYAITILAVLLIGYLLVRAMRSYVPSAPINAKRVEERIAARKDVEAAGLKELNGDPAIINKENAVVRLPITKAMEMVVQGYQNGPAFRSNLLSRVENATKPPPKVSFE